VIFRFGPLPSLRNHKRGARDGAASASQSMLCKAMRTTSTDAERALWNIVRGHRLDGLKFKRQVPIDGYIVDFVYFEARLILEADGGQHSESARDARRDAHFADEGFRTLRFWNNDILSNPDGVAAEILRVVKGS
jgi:very-short-patch-repair endonuclease